MDGLNRLFSGMRVASSGLRAERARMDVIAGNIANAQTTRMPGGSGPYRRQIVHVAPVVERDERGRQELSGVRVTQIGGDFATPFEQIYDPSHPDADAGGIVRMPNVNAVKEMADLISAVRSYEANLTVMENFERMADRALRLAE